MVESPRANPLLFFTDDITSYPKDDRVLITSSKQAIETSLILLSLCRYPHAVLIISEALEKILKVGIRTHKPIGDKRGDFEFLIDEFSKLEKASKKKDDIQNLRLFRNDVAHAGISPEFDEEALSLYCRTGIYALEVAFEEFFNINLLRNADDTPGILYHEYGDLIRHTKKASAKAKCIEDYHRAYSPLVAKLRHGFKPNFISGIENDVLEQCYVNGITDNLWEKEYVDKDAEKKFYYVSCPICHEQMDIKISDDTVEEKKVILTWANCRRCSFSVDRTAFDMHADLFAGDLSEICEEVLKDYGFES